MKPPDWKDGKRLFEWTLAQLRPRQGDQPRKGPSPHQYMIDVLKACELQDADTFVKLMKDPRAARFAFSLIDTNDEPRKVKPKRTDKAALGSTIVTMINELWDEQYGKHQRRCDNQPHASDIAAKLLTEIGLPITSSQIRRHREKYGAP